MGQRNFQLPGTMSETQVIASVELLTDQIQTLLAERDEWKDAATWVATSERPPPAPGVAMSGWRTDMENAPKDGVLLHSPETHTYTGVVAAWCSSSERWEERGDHYPCSPTHWMPLYSYPVFLGITPPPPVSP